MSPNIQTTRPSHLRFPPSEIVARLIGRIGEVADAWALVKFELGEPLGVFVWRTLSKRPQHKD
jgi:hypothetical protein